MLANHKKKEEDKFLADEKSPNVFLHLWSLGVEMQFYLIVPFIFLFLQILKKDVLKFIAVLLTAIIGCIAFLCFNSPIAFNFMPLRLWQFAAGFCALYWNKLNPEEELPENDITHHHLLRHTTPPLRKAVPQLELDPDCVSRLYSHHCQRLRTVQRPGISLLGADVFACSSKIIDANEALEFNFYSSNPNLKDECMMRDMDPPVPAANLYQYCLSPPGNGTLKIMNIGNSYAKNLNEPIRDPFKFNYSEFRYLSVLGGFAIFNDPDTQPHTDLFRQQVQKYKPDVLFITARFSDYFKLPIQDNDQLVQEINDNIKFFEKHAKKIYIMGSMPVFRFNFMNHFLQYVISKPEDLEKLNLDQKIADEERKHAVERLNRVECEKCKIYDPSPEFLENGKYLTFDRNTTMSYVDNSIHITETGFKLLEPTYAKLAREAMDMV
ncbi:hypothetical protein B9Z55_018276 [Caenorhabditis nigoni]|uniref:Uncharacterized protein n=1 Tax=Caenorhabditis nigoni TaxID=1611254 RepID=A0A2G5TDD8_9PELO|nr:hypothetical protein B9Z55_018276 [Caenorhabditis nigoni]